MQTQGDAYVRKRSMTTRLVKSDGSVPHSLTHSLTVLNACEKEEDSLTWLIAAGHFKDDPKMCTEPYNCTCKNPVTEGERETEKKRQRPPKAQRHKKSVALIGGRKRMFGGCYPSLDNDHIK